MSFGVCLDKRRINLQPFVKEPYVSRAICMSVVMSATQNQAYEIHPIQWGNLWNWLFCKTEERYKQYHWTIFVYEQSLKWLSMDNKRMLPLVMASVLWCDAYVLLFLDRVLQQFDLFRGNCQLSGAVKYSEKPWINQVNDSKVQLCFSCWCKSDYYSNFIRCLKDR